MRLATQSDMDAMAVRIMDLEREIVRLQREVYASGLAPKMQAAFGALDVLTRTLTAAAMTVSGEAFDRYLDAEEAARNSAEPTHA